jgi:hypothetical protein
MHKIKLPVAQIAELTRLCEEIQASIKENYLRSIDSYDETVDTSKDLRERLYIFSTGDENNLVAYYRDVLSAALDEIEALSAKSAAVTMGLALCKSEIECDEVIADIKRTNREFL